MSLTRRFYSLLRGFAFAIPITGLTVAILSAEVKAAELSFPEGTYPYSVVEQDLTVVVREFGQNIGVRVQVSPKVQGTVRGKLPRVDAKAFLDHLCRVHGLDWYFDGHVLHVSAANESVTRILKMGRVKYDKLISTLGAAGFLDQRYSITPAADGKSITLAAPPRYVAIVEQNIEVLNASDEAAVTLVKDTSVRTTIYRGKDASTVEFNANGIPLH